MSNRGFRRLPAWASHLLAIVFAISLPTVVLAAIQAPAESARVSKAIKEGDVGPKVEALQRSLNARLSPSPGLDVDGDFGKATKEAIVRFQKVAKLPATGEADEATIRALGTPPPPSPEAPEPEETNKQQLPKAPADPLDGPPFVTARAWAVADGKDGRLIAGGDADKPVDIASTTKIMTAFVILELARQDPSVLQETVVFSDRADQTSGSTSGVREGERLPVRELLFGLLLPSGNDAATAFAEHFGPRLDSPGLTDPFEKFIAAMNRTAAKLGLAESTFRNPHGLTAVGHRSSARDLAKLASLALADPLFAEVVSTRKHGCKVVDAEGKTRNLAWSNTNNLLAIEGFDGVKTGTTDAAGACLVASARKGEERRIVVILGATSGDARYVDARNLFRWAWNQPIPSGR